MFIRGDISFFARIIWLYPLRSIIFRITKFIEMQKGYSVSIQDEDRVIYAGFSKETAKGYIENFEKYINVFWNN